MADLVIVTKKLRVRQGAPRTTAPILRTMAPGAQLEVRAEVDGDVVQGVARWYRIADSEYVWSGGCTRGPAMTAGGVMTPAGANGPSTAVPRVVDLYHGDGVLSFSDARSAGVLGVIHKATTGASGRDDAYERRRDQAQAAGLLWGAYHWGTAAPASTQVKNFLSWANPDASTLVALDWEPTPGTQMTPEIAREFLTLLQQKLGRNAVIYSGHTAKEYLGDRPDAFFGAHRLWLAQYGTHASVQSSWKNYWLWQYSDGEHGPHPSAIPGIAGDSKGRVDCNAYGGSPADLAAQWAS